MSTPPLVVRGAVAKVAGDFERREFTCEIVESINARPMVDELWSTAAAGRGQRACLRRLKPMREIVWVLSLKSMSFLRRQTGLERLWISDCAPRSWHALRSLRSLKELRIHRSHFRDLSIVARLEHLEALEISGERTVRRIPRGTRWTALKSIALMNTNVSLVDQLADLPGIEEVELRGSPVRSVAPLCALKRVTRLGLAGTRVSRLPACAAFTAVVELDISGTVIGDLTPLAAGNSLESLSAVGAPLRSVEPLHAHGRLHSLDLTDTRVERLEGLTTQVLRDLQTCGTPIDEADLWRFVARQPGLLALSVDTVPEAALPVLASLGALRLLRLCQPRPGEMARIKALRPELKLQQ